VTVEASTLVQFAGDAETVVEWLHGLNLPESPERVAVN
jgi:hypothetical protein